jgi:hypothetical protein
VNLLVDAGFPAALDGAPNTEGVHIERVTSAISDRDLIDLAASQGYAAIAFLGSEIASQASLRARASECGVTLICSVTDDPFEADTNLRQSLRSLEAKVRTHRGSVLWLRKDGLRADER